MISLRPQPFRRRRARLAVLWGLFGFVILTLGLNFALDTTLQHWRDPEYGYRIRQLKPLVQQNPRRPLLVALGSSRTQMGFNPAEMGMNSATDPLVYNLSQAGCGPPQQFMNLNRLLADGIRPDYLLIEILPPVMANRGPIEKSFIVERLSFRDLQTVSHYFDNASSVERRWLELRSAPWSACRLVIISQLSPNWLRWQSRQDFLWKQMREFGWLPYFHASVTEQKRAEGLAQAQVQYLPYFPDFDIAPMPKLAHQNIVNLAQEQGIRVAFYTMPESPQFRSWYPASVQQRLEQYYQQLQNEYGTPVFQAHSWLSEETQFADGHHLMRHGATAFSQRFAQDHLRPWLSSHRP